MKELKEFIRGIFSTLSEIIMKYVDSFNAKETEVIKNLVIAVNNHNPHINNLDTIITTVSIAYKVFIILIIALIIVKRKKY